MRPQRHRWGAGKRWTRDKHAPGLRKPNPTRTADKAGRTSPLGVTESSEGPEPQAPNSLEHKVNGSCDIRTTLSEALRISRFLHLLHISLPHLGRRLGVHSALWKRAPGSPGGRGGRPRCGRGTWPRTQGRGAVQRELGAQQTPASPPTWLGDLQQKALPLRAGSGNPGERSHGSTGYKRRIRGASSLRLSPPLAVSWTSARTALVSQVPTLTRPRLFWPWADRSSYFSTCPLPQASGHHTKAHPASPSPRGKHKAAARLTTLLAGTLTLVLATCQVPRLASHDTLPTDFPKGSEKHPATLTVKLTHRLYSA